MALLLHIDNFLFSLLLYPHYPLHTIDLLEF